jgi:hypothetical protein
MSGIIMYWTSPREGTLYEKEICLRLRVIRVAAACALFAVLSGCATNFRTTQPFAGKAPPTSLYVYSFLDLREGTMGPRFLGEVRDQLGKALESRGVRQKQLWFNESPLRTEYALEAKRAGSGASSMRVPVGEVIAATRDEEEAFGASHRLVIFPVEVTQSNTFSGFQVRWDVIDAKTNERNWSTTSYTQHTKWFLGDENPQDRARSFVEAALTEMEKAGVFKR